MWGRSQIEYLKIDPETAPPETITWQGQNQESFFAAEAAHISLCSEVSDAGLKAGFSKQRAG